MNDAYARRLRCCLLGLLLSPQSMYWYHMLLACTQTSHHATRTACFPLCLFYFPMKNDVDCTSFINLFFFGYWYATRSIEILACTQVAMASCCSNSYFKNSFEQANHEARACMHDRTASRHVQQQQQQQGLDTH
jgi:hypothetical protein